ncbi:MAG: adenylate/guanylate cyclase domain-containing protein [Planctomycetes bacterium]|nr:adenylate/guanylate cyclase domain-containing protein [Planctomycetota bacterium]
MAAFARLRSPALRGVWIGLACALVAWLAVQLSLLRGLEDWMLDGCFALRGKRSTNSHIVIVALDEPSLAELIKPRTSLSPELAQVVRYARAQGATAIGIDVLIPADRAKLADLQQGGEGDALTLGQAVVQTGNVTLPVWKLDQGWLRPVPDWLLKAESPDAETADLGFVNFQEDGDQFLRRQLLLGKDGDRLLPQLALALYARSRGQDVEIDERGRPVVGGAVIPVDDEGLLRINYVGPRGSFETLSFAEVLKAAKNREKLPLLNGAVVLIGVTARDQQDYHSTPYANNYTRWLATAPPGRMPGVEIHANILATLADRAWIHTPLGLSTLPWLLLLGVLLGHVLSRVSLERGFVIAVVHHFAWKGIALAGFAWFHWRIEMMAMLLLGFLVYATTFALRWRTLRRMFGVVKSEALALALEADPRQLNPGGEERAVTVLFADVRGFTDFSERHTAQEVVALLNAYFGVVVPAVEAEGGVIDKFMGDGIMVLFGAPVSLPDHAARAARAAAAMVRAVHEGRQTWARLGNPEMRIGVGLHTGKVVVGAIGSPGRLDYTAVGDVVNAASRIESENKAQGTEILLSAATCSLLTGQERARLGVEPQPREVKVKGREEKLLLHAVQVP